MRIRLRRGTTAQWTAANPTLQAGEPGVDLTTGTLKIGNGATAWGTLPAISGGAGTYSLPDGIDPPATFRQPITPGRTSINLGMALNTLYAVPLPMGNTARTLTELAVEVRVAAGAGGLLRASLLSSTGRFPNLETNSFGTVASDTTGIKTWAPGLLLAANTLYWAGVNATVAAPSVVAIDAFNPYVAINVGLSGTTAFGAYLMNPVSAPLGATPFTYFDVDVAIRVTAQFS
jgi:major tropism determinant Mtd-like protein